MERLKELLIDTYIKKYQLEKRFKAGNYSGANEHQLRMEITEVNDLVNNLTESYIDIMDY